MPPLVTTTADHTAPAIPHADSLSADPAEWPTPARKAYRGVLAELDSWCRIHDSCKMLNSWIAEEAVRQCL